MARRAGDAAARVGAGAAHVEAGDGGAIIGMTGHRAQAVELVQVERAVEDVAPHQAELALQVQRREHLAA